MDFALSKTQSEAYKEEMGPVKSYVPPEESKAALAGATDLSRAAEDNGVETFSDEDSPDEIIILYFCKMSPIDERAASTPRSRQ